MASRFVAAALRGTCRSGAGISKVACPDSGGLQCSRGSFSEGAPKVLLPAKAQDKNKWLIEIFSGSCHLSAAVVRAGYRVLAIDILYGSSCDILSPAVRQAIREFVVEHPVALHWYGSGCLARAGHGLANGMVDLHSVMTLTISGAIQLFLKLMLRKLYWVIGCYNILFFDEHAD